MNAGGSIRWRHASTPRVCAVMTDVSVTTAVTSAITTARGTTRRVLSHGPDNGTPVLFLHDVAGLLEDHRFVAELGDAGFHVVAAELPSYGRSTGEELL